jgi:hypothetical protein
MDIGKPDGEFPSLQQSGGDFARLAAHRAPTQT